MYSYYHGWSIFETHSTVKNLCFFLYFAGRGNGKIDYYKNEGTKSNANFVKKTGSANPFDGIGFGSCAAPTLIDFNGDGAMDALVGDRDGLLNYCLNSGTATSPSYSACTTTFSGTNPTGNPFINIDIRKDDKGGVVTPGKDTMDHGYTKPFAIDSVSFIFVTRFKCLFADNDVAFFGQFINLFLFPL